MTEPGQIFSRMNKVMQEVGAVGKNKKNQQQSYNFRAIDDVIDACHPAFVRNEIFITSEVLESRREEHETKSGTRLYYSILRAKFTFYAPDGSNVCSVTEGEGMDTGDKATNKAMSAALKYALGQTLMIPFEVTDSENDSHEAKGKEAALAESIVKWKKSIDSYKEPVALTSMMMQFRSFPREQSDQLIPYITEHAQKCGLVWDESKKQFLEKQKPTNGEAPKVEDNTKGIEECNKALAMVIKPEQLSALIPRVREMKSPLREYWRKAMMEHATRQGWMYDSDKQLFRTVTEKDVDALPEVAGAGGKGDWK
jgi:hypothetical protein